MKKQTLATRVLAFLKGGDEQKAARFESKLERYFKDQRGIREREIERLEDKKLDLKEALREAIPNVDFANLGKIEGVEGYIPQYVTAIGNRVKAIEAIDDLIEVQQAEIDYLNSVEEAIYADENTIPEIEESK